MVLAMALCFTVLETTAKWLSRSYPVPMVVWARYAVHVWLMIIIFLPRMRLDLVRTVQPTGQLARATLMLGSTLCNFGAISFLPLAEVKAISFVSPLLVTAFAVWLLKEHVSTSRWIAIMVGFGGTLFIVRPGSAMLNPAVFLALGSAFCYSLYQILTRRISGGDGRPRVDVGGSAARRETPTTEPFELVEEAISAINGCKSGLALDVIRHRISASKFTGTDLEMVKEAGVRKREALQQ